MKLPHELIDDLRSRINPAYAITPGTESYERRLCAEALESLLAAVFDGTLMSYRWCSECCAAMAASWTDDGRAWEDRVRLGDESSNAELSRPLERSGSGSA